MPPDPLDPQALARAYAGRARAIVSDMIVAAAAEPARSVSFQGAPGANSHVALSELFPRGLPLPCFSFEQAIDAVSDDHAAHAVIPIENSLFGRVADIHALLATSGLAIVGEHFLPIRHCLLGTGPRQGVRRAISHPQALGQCRKWLRAQGIEPVVYDDTAGAAAVVADLGDPALAALAPEGAARVYGLEILAADIADARDNTTRFVTLTRPPRAISGSGPWMTTLLFEVGNEPAALYRALGSFATNRVNVTRLESYQRRGKVTAVEFYADFEGARGEPKVDRALDELTFQAKHVRIIGTYARSPRRPQLPPQS